MDGEIVPPNKISKEEEILKLDVQEAVLKTDSTGRNSEECRQPLILPKVEEQPLFEITGSKNHGILSSSGSDSDSDSDSSVSTSDLSSSSSASSSDSNPETDLPLNLNKASKSESKPTVYIEEGLENLPPVEELHINIDAAQLKVFGAISNIIGIIVLVKPIKEVTAKLSLDSILFRENAEPFGKIEEVIGNVSDPLYSVRFNNIDDICDRNIKVNEKILFAPNHPEYTDFIFIEQMRNMTFTDASGKFDQEVDSDEFSDDEEEVNHKARLRQQRKETARSHGSNHSQKRKKFKFSQDSNQRWSDLTYPLFQPTPPYSLSSIQSNPATPSINILQLLSIPPPLPPAPPPRSLLPAVLAPQSSTYPSNFSSIPPLKVPGNQQANCNRF